MMKLHRQAMDADLVAKMQADCSNCCGICCVALYFAKSEGFPSDKAQGTPCANLLPDFRCAIHAQPAYEGLRGCRAYDCLGAGQQVSRVIYGGRSWQANPAQATQMFEVFLVVQQLRQMLWYLVEAAALSAADALRTDIEGLILKNEYFTQLTPAEILALNVGGYRGQVNQALQRVSELVSLSIAHEVRWRKETDLLGKNFKKADLSGHDLSMKLLIAANFEDCRLYGTNFLGADLRDANFCNTDLSATIFLTQGQLNAARGNSATKLPAQLRRPSSWSNY